MVEGLEPRNHTLVREPMQSVEGKAVQGVPDDTHRWEPRLVRGPAPIAFLDTCARARVG